MNTRSQVNNDHAQNALGTANATTSTSPAPAPAATAKSEPKPKPEPSLKDPHPGEKPRDKYHGMGGRFAVIDGERVPVDEDNKPLPLDADGMPLPRDATK